MGGSLTADKRRFLTQADKQDTCRGSYPVRHGSHAAYREPQTLRLRTYPLRKTLTPAGSETGLSQFLINNIGVFRIVLNKLLEVEKAFLLDIGKGNCHPFGVAPNDF